METKGKYALGDPIDIYCRYCKLNLNGVVSAVVNDRVVKVQCRTCRLFQDYKPPIDERVQRQKSIRKVLRLRERKEGGHAKTDDAPQNLDQASVARRLWDEATKDVNPLKSRVYNPALTFHKEDLISHPDWGLGVVAEEEEHRILVLFRDGFKSLEHNRPRPDTEE